MQVTNTRIAPLAGDQIVPTDEVRRGDFRRIMSAACRGGTARTLGAPFANNQIDPALYHPISLKIMRMLPMPDAALDPDGCGRYVLAIPNDCDEQQYIGRARLSGAAATTGCSAATSTPSTCHAPLFDSSESRTC